MDYLNTIHQYLNIYSTYSIGVTLTGILQLIAFFIAIYMLYKCYQDRVPSKAARTESDGGQRSYTACSSPNCVRCHRYQKVCEKAERKLIKFSKKSAGGCQHLINAARNSNKYKLISQQPNVFYLPHLHAQAWWNNKFFSEDVDILENNCDEIQKEFMSVFRTRHHTDSGWTRNSAEGGSWATFYLCNQGAEITENCQRCPRTHRILRSFQGTMADCIFGNILFSVLMPGTEIAGHYGPTNIRIRCHLGLKVPPRCSLTVDNTSRQWQEGECLLFDDSFYHSACYHGNPSSEMEDLYRAVLMFDMWHPDISTFDKQALLYAFGTEKD